MNQFLWRVSKSLTRMTVAPVRAKRLECGAFTAAFARDFPAHHHFASLLICARPALVCSFPIRVHLCNLWFNSDV